MLPVIVSDNGECNEYTRSDGVYSFLSLTSESGDMETDIR